MRSNRCPHCNDIDITRFPEKTHIKVAYDLKISRTGIRRQVIHCAAALHKCKGCEKFFLPKRYKRRDKHFHALKSWAMYHHIAHRISLVNLESICEECFGLRVNYQELHMIKSLMGKRYRVTWKQILETNRFGKPCSHRRNLDSSEQGKGVRLGIDKHGGGCLPVPTKPGR